MSRRELSPIQRLMAAMDRCAVARGEAQFTMGYRTGRFAVDRSWDLSPDGQRMVTRENAQWAAVGNAENSFRRLALKLLREARASRPSRSLPPNGRKK